MTEDPTSTELFSALRGQRVEVTGAPGGPISGRLMSIETREEKIGSDNNASSVQKFYLTVLPGPAQCASSNSHQRSACVPLISTFRESSIAISSCSTTHSTGLRHLTLELSARAQRQLHVSYISEVPVWKATYRMVFPRANGNATVQGWAVVDNTVGADWDNVQLALVAGARRASSSRSRNLSTRVAPRSRLPPTAQTTPQTHEAAETANVQSEMMKKPTGRTRAGAAGR